MPFVACKIYISPKPIEIMHKLLLNGKSILLGNEAVVRGALEAGLGFASTYPGTPASEIGDAFAEIAKEAGIYFEYSVNEKVALEAAAGASFSGVKSFVSFKHFGLNVASDSVFPIAYTGAKGLVIAVADDPNCWSSAQSEQDSRWFARLAKIPMFEPASPQECKDFTKLAFQLSEKFDIPVFLRLTTRSSHMRGIVKLGKIVKGPTQGFFKKDLKKFDNIPPHTMRMHEELLQKIEKIRHEAEKSKLNFIVNPKAKSDFGIIVAGVAFDYVMDTLEDMNLKIPVLKLGLTYPLPAGIISNFIKKFKSVLIAEEIDPILEDEIRALAKDVNPELKIFGKEEYLPKSGELTEEKIISAIEKITAKKYSFDLQSHSKKFQKIKSKIAHRFPLLCPGCQHRATFYAAKAAAPDAVFGGDIGCYILGIYPPYEVQDFIFSMGAVQGITHGIKKVSQQKVISFIGDSTFFHAGMPGLLNMAYNKSNPLVIVLDNRITAMTGHQPNPSTGLTATGEQTKEADIAAIAKAFGIENVKTVDPFNLKQTEDAIREFLNSGKLSLIVAKRECELLAVRKKKKAGMRIAKFEIDQTKCKKVGACLYRLACPAIYKEGKNFFIDKSLCTGCAVCVQVCPNHAIRPVVETQIKTETAAANAKKRTSR